jgi:isocitrate dehydrogenase kinase/phosphatase
MNFPLPDRTGSPPADVGVEVAERVLVAFDDYHEMFRDHARRARHLFLQRTWRGLQENARDRLLLYSAVLDDLLEEIRLRLGESAADPQMWAQARDAFARSTEDRDTGEVARTFFNSASRRAQGTVGIRPRTEFVGDDAIPGTAPEPLRLLRYPAAGSIEELFLEVFDELAKSVPLADAERDARLVADAVAGTLEAEARSQTIEAVEFVPGLFFRNKAAYMVGRIVHGPGESDASITPLVLPMRHDEDGVRVDAVLMNQDRVSVVFGFSRSYFKADIEPGAGGPRALVAFLRTLMPGRREHELFTSIGYNRHGKTLLYRALREHLALPAARIEPAEGVPGLVMLVFTIPSLDVVLKVTRDRFAPPKRTNRDRVRNRYRLVFLHDRVGRLADAQQFEGLEFPAAVFEPELLDELLREASSTVRRQGDTVTVDHAYSERRLTPLDVHLARAAQREDAEAERAAILDYGQAIRELAAANIFPGDLLLKNFGVTRHGRVIFYDYDELALLIECNFREFPQAIHDEDEFSAEPWFYVAESDVFPEEFPKFIRIPRAARDEFMACHGDLFTAAFWKEMQELARSGEVADFFPYPESRRLPRE